MDDEERVDPYFLLITPFDGMNVLTHRGKEWSIVEALHSCEEVWQEAASDFMQDAKVGGDVKIQRSDGVTLTLIRTR